MNVIETDGYGPLMTQIAPEVHDLNRANGRERLLKQSGWWFGRRAVINQQHARLSTRSQKVMIENGQKTAN